MDTSALATRGLNLIEAPIAFWNRYERCEFSNQAYLEWFGRTADAMSGISLEDLLGPMYFSTQTHIAGALRGIPQHFERRVALPAGNMKACMVNYLPDFHGGGVSGFWAHVVDVSALRAQEAELARLKQEHEQALNDVWSLSGLLGVCAGCKLVRNASGEWYPLETYVGERHGVEVTHSMCPKCVQVYYPGIRNEK